MSRCFLTGKSLWHTLILSPYQYNVLHMKETAPEHTTGNKSCNTIALNAPHTLVVFRRGMHNSWVRSPRGGISMFVAGPPSTLNILETTPFIPVQRRKKFILRIMYSPVLCTLRNFCLHSSHCNSDAASWEKCNRTFTKTHWRGKY